jgi:hypothetical protein
LFAVPSRMVLFLDGNSPKQSIVPCHVNVHVCMYIIYIYIHVCVCVYERNTPGAQLELGGLTSDIIIQPAKTTRISYSIIPVCRTVQIPIPHTYLVPCITCHGRTIILHTLLE